MNCISAPTIRASRATKGNYAIRVRLKGDEVLKAEADGGYLHRGFEKLMEERLWIQNVALVPRICVPDPVPMEETYARAVEMLGGLNVPERAQWIRVMVLEMSRIAAHLFMVGGHAATLGLYTNMFWGVALWELLLDRFEELTGGRIYHMYITPGGVRRDLPDGFLGRLAAALDEIERRLPDYDDLFFDNAVMVRRTRGIGTLTQAEALAWGGSPGRTCAPPALRSICAARTRILSMTALPLTFRRNGRAMPWPVPGCGGRKSASPSASCAR